ncbi:hypothetical protein [Methylophaga sp.]|uniref:IS1/IS1595 family N-terminal zinc-binding domain-containing protein n=1 Tax=Methylophaga sp. TaxID=2024840 RepID=UPI001754AE0A|nr:hypothetical protein [Methylophaga sp.]HIC45648.1 IS1 family transposase [Methylophaga sp.]
MSGKRRGPKRKSVEIMPYAGIQANHCKNPACANFGISYEDDPSDPRYTRSGSTQVTPPLFREPASKANHPALGRPNATLFIQCRLCSGTLPLKNNRAIHSVMKIWKYHPDNQSCPNISCLNHGSPLQTGLYKKNGTTKSGTARWLCKACGKSFVEKAAVRAPRTGEKPYRREDVVMGFVNGLAIRRMQELYGINAASIYHHLEKAYEACVRFHSARMERLPSVLEKRGAVYFSTDRQDLLVNWTDRHKRNAIVVKAVCSVDVDTGFAYRYDVGIDDHNDAQQIHKESIDAEDVDKAYIFRKYPHLFLPSDMSHERRLNAFVEQEIIKARRSDPDISDVQLKYLESHLRQDVELPSFHLTEGTGLPKNSLLIREDYQLYAHYQLLAEQFGFDNDITVVNYSDQESGLRAAFMSAFGEKVKKHQAELYYIRFLKGATREEREAASVRTEKRLSAVMKAQGCSREQAKLILCEIALQGRQKPVGHWSDNWGDHPLETPTEVYKAYSHMTDFGNKPLSIRARYLKKATLHPVDNYFMRVRRRVSQLERGIPTASRDRRIWYGKCFYRPDLVKKVSMVLMTYLNYVSLDGKKTPAEKLGLAKGPVRLRDILFH